MAKSGKIGLHRLSPAERKLLLLQSNPMAKALNRAKEESQRLTDFLKMYSLGKGEWDPGLARRISHRLAMSGMACELAWPEEDMPPEVRVEYNIIRGALSAVEVTAGKWDPSQVVAIERGLEAASLIEKKVPKEHLEQANQDAMKMELAALLSLKNSTG